MGTIREKVRTRLTDGELLDAGRALAQLADDVASAESALSQAKRTHKRTIAGLDERADELRGLLTTGFKSEYVDCHEAADFGRGVVRIYRNDTYEMVRERPMSETERQLSLTAAKDAAATERRRVTEELVELQRVPPEDAP